MIKLALLEDPSRSDRAIGELVGCHGETVTTIRRELEGNAEIRHYVTPLDRKGNRSLVLAPCCSTGEHRDMPESAEESRPEPEPEWQPLAHCPSSSAIP